MAIIKCKEFKRDDTKHPRKNTEALSTYSIGKGGIDGQEKVVQINMYGSDERKDKNPPYEKKSQVIQINKELAIMLVDILKKEFKIY